MKVHFGVHGATEAPCGYKFERRLHSLDRFHDWNMTEARLVEYCLECLMHRPPKWKRHTTKFLSNRKQKT